VSQVSHAWGGGPIQYRLASVDFIENLVQEVVRFGVVSAVLRESSHALLHGGLDFGAGATSIHLQAKRVVQARSDLRDFARDVVVRVQRPLLRRELRVHDRDDALDGKISHASIIRLNEPEGHCGPPE